jgi:hypothetical protein
MNRELGERAKRLELLCEKRQRMVNANTTLRRDLGTLKLEKRLEPRGRPGSFGRLIDIRQRLQADHLRRAIIFTPPVAN